MTSKALDQTIRRARRRWSWRDAIDRGGVGLAGAVAFLVVVLAADRFFRLQLAWWIYPVVAGAATLLAGATAVLRRPSRLDVANTLDLVHDLENQLGTATELRDAARAQDAAFSALVDAKAERLAERVDVRRAVPLRLAPSWGWGAAGGVLLALGIFIVPDRAVPATDAEVAHQAEEAMTDKVVESMETALDDLRDVEPDILDSVADELDALDALADQLRTGEAADPQAVREDSAVRFNEVAEELEREAAHEEQVARRVADRFEGLGGRDGADDPADDLRERLARGEFDRAAEDLEDLVNAARNLPEEDRAALADALRELGDDSNAPGAHASSSDSRHEIVREALRDGGLDDETIDRLLDESRPADIDRELERTSIDPELADELRREIERLRDEQTVEHEAERSTEDVAEALRRAAEMVDNGEAMPPPPAEETTPPPQEGEQPRDGQTPRPPQEGEQPRDGQTPRPPQEGEQPQDGQSPRQPQEGEQPQDGQSQRQPQEGEQPQDGQSPRQPQEGEQPKDGQSQRQPQEGEQPQDGQSQRQPQEGEQPKDGQSPRQPQEAEQPQDGQTPRQPQEGEQPKDGQSPRQPQEGEQPKDGQSPRQPQEGEQPQDGQTPRQPQEGEQPQDGQTPRQPQEGEQPQDGQTPRQPQEGEQPKDGQSPRQPQEGEQPKDGQSPRQPQEGEQPQDGQTPRQPQEGGQPPDGATPQLPPQGAPSPPASTPETRSPAETLREMARRRNAADGMRRAAQRAREEAGDLSGVDGPPGTRSTDPRFGTSERTPLQVTEDVDLAGEAGEDGRTIAEWFDRSTPGAEGVSGRTPGQRAQRAQKAAERAVEDATIPARYHEYIQRYFKRFGDVTDRAAPGKNASSGSTAPAPTSKKQ